MQHALFTVVSVHMPTNWEKDEPTDCRKMWKRVDMVNCCAREESVVCRHGRERRDSGRRKKRHLAGKEHIACERVPLEQLEESSGLCWKRTQMHDKLQKTEHITCEES